MLELKERCAVNGVLNGDIYTTNLMGESEYG